MTKQHIRIESEFAGLSVTGPVREDNQDAILLPNQFAVDFPGFLYAVADGMGGYSNGGLASKLALQNLFSMVCSSKISLSPAKVLRQAVDIANREVYKAALMLGSGKMGTTLTAAYVYGEWLYLLHVGDSRAYLIRNGRAACLTSDHTLVGDLVRSHLIPAENARSHYQRSILTKAVGLDLFVQPELSQVRLQVGDCIVLCSDGVWSVLEDQEFAELSDQSNNMNFLVQELIDKAIERNTDDNCSAVAFYIYGFCYQTF